MPDTKLAVGDVVVLNSDDIKQMTVTSVDETDVRVQWWHQDELKFADLDARALTCVSPKAKRPC